MKPYLSVIIPCYNEEPNLKRGVLKEVENYFKKQLYLSEIIISDDGSTDGSLRWVERFVKYHPRFKVLKNEHAGKPFAVRAGLRKARGEIILITDMDQSTPIDQLERLLPFFTQGFEVVIGSRGQKRTGFSFFRRLASRLFLLFRKALLLREIDDTQCGFKAFKRRAIKRIFSKLAIFKDSQKVKGWRVSAYDVEVLFIAKKLGYQIKEVIVDWEDKDVSVGKQRNFIKESKEMFFEILRVKLNDWRGVYN